jgi:hypothetical protein
MSDALYGAEWHALVHTPQAGWHRWTGPGARSELRLPIPLAGTARLEIAIVSACDDDAVRSLRVMVQYRRVEHSVENRPRGIAVVGDVQLDPRRPLTVALEVSHTRHLVDGETGTRSPDKAGVAVGDILLSYPDPF